MGNRYNKQRKEQHINVGTGNSSSSRSLLPILCSKTSIKDVATVPSIRLDLPDDDRSEEESIITDQEPLSPKVGCMGQVKKRSNRVSAGAHTSFSQQLPNRTPLNTNKNKSSTTRSVVVSVKYFKLRKLFSIASPARDTIAATGIRSNSWVGPRSKKKPCSNQELSFIREMDPPLPVVIRKVKPEEDEEDNHGEGGGSSLLWKRRFGDVSALKTLDLKLNHQLKTIPRCPPPPQPLTV